ncbi:hypothetical protein YTPLAS18_34050 [Nitrospira sp.]|nr:hypothetical protein YTPLAS18_34050 [Nitrospira sp.]
MPPAPASPEQLLVFTDLDGSLLDPVTYSWDNAREALEQLSSREIPLILVSSKTRAEIEPLRLELQHRHPFITENGGAIFIPQGYFMSVSQEARIREGFEVIELGAPYASLLRALRDIEHAAGIQLRGFHDMTVDEVATRTGLTLDEAELAMRREYDEPFIIEGPPSLLPVIQREAAERQLSVTTGVVSIISLVKATRAGPAFTSWTATVGTGTGRPSPSDRLVSATARTTTRCWRSWMFRSRFSAPTAPTIQTST